MRYAGILLVLISVGASAQFQEKWHIKLPAGSEPLQVNWADVDNDSLLDLVLATRIGGKVTLVAYADSAFLSSHTLATTEFVSGTFSFCDFNRDNRIDIIMSGSDGAGNPSTEVYLNQGAWVFQKLSSSLAPFASPKVVFTDLNADGQQEFVMSGASGHLTAWKWNGSSATQLFDSTRVVPQDILVHDFDGNGFNDIAVSGTDGASNPKMLIIEFANAFDTIRTIRFAAPLSGKMDAGDVNNDGAIDLLVSGLDKNGNHITQTFLNHDSTFVDGPAWNNIDAASLRIADIDADGLADISVQGQDLNVARMASGDSIILPSFHVTSQALGDFDRDGDLDLVQLMDTLGLVVLENQTLLINQKPSAPNVLLNMVVFNRMFLYWTKMGSVNQPAATYDLLLMDESALTYAAEFDTANWERMTVSHGNMTSNNFALMHIPLANYQVWLQTVDNAYLGSKPFILDGPGGPCQPEEETITVCSPDPVKLAPKTPQPALWFSFSKGFLGLHDTLQVDSKTDTVFSVRFDSGPVCDQIKIYLINSAADTVRVTHTTTTCEGTTVDLAAAAEWKNVVWRNPAADSVGSGQSIQYVVNKEEVITAIGHNDHGCVLKQMEDLRISKPVLVLNGDAFHILKGESVGLSASGADTYVWTPNLGLDNGFIPNPTASPATTTTYTVTGYDSLGCTASAQVIVEVEETAFVPNLFTPNGDGKNDELKIYGLTQAKGFRFVIHNRDGNLVYEASDVMSVSSRGWDGSTRGVEQPTGLYYWKVEGNFDDGSSMRLNGRTTGSILLVR